MFFNKNSQKYNRPRVKFQIDIRRRLMKLNSDQCKSANWSSRFKIYKEGFRKKKKILIRI